MQVPCKKMSCIQQAREMMNILFPDLHKDAVNKDKYRETIINIVDSCLKVDELCFAKDLFNRYILDTSTFIVPDLRRKCEMDYFKNKLPSNTKFILVENPRIEKVDSYGEGSIDDYNLWDYVVSNNGSLENLNEKAKIVATDILTGSKSNSSPTFLV
jgi:hypothetical protein